VGEHIFETRHNINFSSISILDKATGYMDRVTMEVIEIRLHPRNKALLSAGPGNR